MHLAEYHRPVDVMTVRRLLARTPAVALLAGGATLVPELVAGAAGTVVDLCDLPLAFADTHPDGLHLGALLTLASLTPASAAGGWANGLLARAAQAAGPINRRNVATVGGLVARADSTSIFWLALLALEAQAIVVAADGPPRQVALRTLADMPADASALQGHLLLEVLLPQRLAQARYGLATVARTPRDEAIVAAVAVVTPTRTTVTVVLGGATGQPLVLSGLQEFTPDPARLPEALADLLARQEMVSDFRGCARYRRQMAGFLARRSLSQALV